MDKERIIECLDEISHNMKEATTSVDVLKELLQDGGYPYGITGLKNSIEEALDELKDVREEINDYSNQEEEKGMKESLKNTTLTEDVDDERAVALASYLGIDVNDVENSYGDEYTTPEGDYLVLTEDEAYQREKEYIKDLIDELGFYELFGENADSLAEGNIDEDWFKEFFEEDFTMYLDDIETDGDSDFENRLLHEMYDEGVLTDEYIQEDENGVYVLTDDANLEMLKEEMVERLLDGISGEYAYQFEMNFGKNELDKVVNDYNLIDTDAVAEECISIDGVGHNLASYDGYEIDLGNGLFAYRVN